ncbi:MAG: hypothetical protein OEY31_08535, partial [Candidatus Bathyarchaeota archaeon]|nr:hypothetical protein [Candidatus Bathyarchaeota archaeon]
QPPPQPEKPDYAPIAEFFNNKYWKELVLSNDPPFSLSVRDFYMGNFTFFASFYGACDYLNVHREYGLVHVEVENAWVIIENTGRHGNETLYARVWYGLIRAELENDTITVILDIQDLTARLPEADWSPVDFSLQVTYSIKLSPEDLE